MPMTTRYTVIDGEIIAETRNGVRREYVPDSQGNTVALLDNTQTQTDTFEYWPYGEDAGRTGTTPTPFRYVGTWGYYRDGSSRTYVRARTLDTQKGLWITVDALWPMQPAYQYAGSNPGSYSDTSGSLRIILDPSCKRSPYKRHNIASVVSKLCTQLRQNPTCGAVCGGWPHIYKCLMNKCSGIIRVHCLTESQCQTTCPSDANGTPCACSATPGAA